MRLVSERDEALRIYARCAKAGVAMVAACCESTGEIEGFLMAAQAYAEEHRIDRIPVNIGFTGVYPENAQLLKISTSCRLSNGGNALDGGDVVNIARTAEYVKRFGELVVVEGAVDRIYQQEQALKLGVTKDKLLTTPERAVKYLKETGVDFIVPNLGTEHRVTSEKGYVKRYEKERARAITQAVGRKQVLHGTSCLAREITTLVDDGIIKVNIYTRIAVESGVGVYSDLKANEEMVLKERNLAINSPTYRNEVHRLGVARVTRDYFDAFRYDTLAEVSSGA